LVPYEDDTAAALQKAREEVFRAGNYTRTGRKQPQSIEEALEQAGEDGTNSVLDVTGVAKRRTTGAVAPLTRRMLMQLFGTERPSEKDWWDNYFAVWDALERGAGIVVVLYKDGQPDKLMFAGLSYD
jgi:hypothetical protein